MQILLTYIFFSNFHSICTLDPFLSFLFKNVMYNNDNSLWICCFGLVHLTTVT